MHACRKDTDVTARSKQVLEKALDIGGKPKREPGTDREPEPGKETTTEPEPTPKTRTSRLVGTIPPEVWNRLNTKLIPKLRSGSDLEVA